MELAAQRRPLFLDRHVSVCSAPQIHPLDRLPQLLAGRLALDHPVALARSAPVVGKAQKLEHLGIVTLTRGTAEVQQPRLGLLKLETVAAKSLG